MIGVIREYLIVIGVTLALAFGVRFFVLEAYRVPGGAMEPTVRGGDHIFVNKLAYGFRYPYSGMASTRLKIPSRGDVVVFSLFSDPQRDFIKRVVGLPGDHVRLRGEILEINGQVVSQAQGGADEQGERWYKESLGQRVVNVHWRGQVSTENVEFIVPEGQLFVLSDLRSSRQDSRIWGFVPLSGLKGRVWMVWLSVAEQGVQWSRMLQEVI